MFETVRTKSALLPLAFLVVGAAAGALIAKSGASFVKPSLAASILETANQGAGSAMQKNFDSLMKIGGKSYRIHVDDSVDLTAKKTAYVKKISGGKVTGVKIATTPTGTYSTDGFRSKNVLYPGINVERVKPVVKIEKFSIAYLPLAETRHVQGYFSAFDKFFASHPQDNGCLSETSYIACK